MALEESAKMGLRMYSEIAFFVTLSPTSFSFFFMTTSGLPLLHILKNQQPLFCSGGYEEES